MGPPRRTRASGELPADERLYHVVVFEQAIEAEAFRAALSRFLGYPQGRVSAQGPSRAQVWGIRGAAGEPCELYLSDGALEAARSVFAPVPVAGTRRGKTMPPGCVPMLEDLDPPGHNI